MTRAAANAMALTVSAFLSSGCLRPPTTPPGPPPATASAAAVRAIADEYMIEWPRRFPHEATVAGIPGLRHDTLPDNSASGEAAWHKKEDVWLAGLQAIRSADLIGHPAWVTYGLLRSELEASTEGRVCRQRLWNVSHLGGPVNRLAHLAAVQPVGTHERRAETLARFQRVPGFLDAEVANLREGVRLGYTAQKNVVERVLVQLDALVGAPVEESPFYKPASRDPDPEFTRVLARLVADEITPAVRRYRDYLKQDYLAAARPEPSLAGNPQGEACYAALVRRFTTLDLSPRQVHDLGRQRLPMAKEELRAFARARFGDPDAQKLLRAAAEQPAQAVTREEVMPEADKRVRAVRNALPRFFNTLPRAELTIEATPAFEESEAPPARYRPAALDGTRPGAMLVNLAASSGRGRRLFLDSLAFHEGVPGHHLQFGLARERPGAHPVEQVIWSAAFGEGWALYAEVLADEMGAYSSDMARLSRMSRDLWQTALLTSETGALALGWTRQQAIDYLVAEAGDAPAPAAVRTDRQAAFPGQMLSYMVGRLEIQRLREEARGRLGSRFDLREFHERVLENGTVTLPMLREHVERWMARSRP